MLNYHIITGSSGFVGLNLSNFFIELNQSVLLVTRTPKTSFINEISYNDLDVGCLDKAKSFIHLAGKAHDLHNTSQDQEYFEVNTNLTKKLFNQFLKSKCKVFIYMSSIKAVADVGEEDLDENIKPNPVTAYGKSKLAAEQFIENQKIPENKRVYILRPCMIHGEGNKGNLNLLYKVVLKRIPWLLGLFDNKRSFCSFENLSFIIKELIDNDNIRSDVYNISDDDPLSTNEIIGLISQSQSEKPLIWNTPKNLVKCLARIGDVIPFPLNSDRLKKLTESFVVSNKKIKKAIGKPLPINSKDGMLNTFNSFKDYQK